MTPSKQQAPKGRRKQKHFVSINMNLKFCYKKLTYHFLKFNLMRSLLMPAPWGGRSSLIPLHRKGDHHQQWRLKEGDHRQCRRDNEWDRRRCRRLGDGGSLTCKPEPRREGSQSMPAGASGRGLPAMLAPREGGVASMSTPR